MTISKLLSAATLMLSAFAATPAAATIVISQSGLSTYDHLENFQTPFLSGNTAVTTQSRV